MLCSCDESWLNAFLIFFTFSLTFDTSHFSTFSFSLCSCDEPWLNALLIFFTFSLTFVSFIIYCFMLDIFLWQIRVLLMFSQMLADFCNDVGFLCFLRLRGCRKKSGTRHRKFKNSKVSWNRPNWLSLTKSVHFGSQDLEIISRLSSFTGGQQ